MMLPEIKNILLATDFSQSAWKAMNYAAALARVHSARVYCLHVLPELPKELALSSGSSGFYDLGPGMAGVLPTSSPFYEKRAEGRKKQEQEAQQKALELARDHLKNLILKLDAEVPGSPLRTEDVAVRSGDPVRTILQEVDSGSFDLLVMGRRGHGKLRWPRIGGVAQAVLNYSSIPVLIIGRPASKS
ncbi:MAG: universal stress protein [Desulfohalobiaceae bacterium]